MKFLITFIIRDIFSLSEIGVVQKRFADAVPKIMQTGKVKDAGITINDRSGYFIVEAGSAEEILGWFNALYDVAKIEVQPVVSFDVLPKLFEELGKLPR